MPKRKKKKDEMSLFNRAMEGISRSFRGADAMDEYQALNAPKRRAATPDTATRAQMDIATAEEPTRQTTQEIIHSLNELNKRSSETRNSPKPHLKFDSDFHTSSPAHTLKMPFQTNVRDMG